MKELRKQFRQLVKEEVLKVLPEDVRNAYIKHPECFRSVSVNVHGYTEYVFPHPNANLIAQRVSDEIPRQIQRIEKMKTMFEILTPEEKEILKGLFNSDKDFRK